MCSGLLLLLDAGLTLTWQEPVSAFMASRNQAELDDELAGLNERAAAERRGLASLDMEELARRQRREADRGDAVGRLRMPTLGRSYVVVQGTDLGTLRKGPGHFPKTPLPGEGGTVGVAGHRTTYGAPFRTVDDLKRGHELVMEMPYGRFTYRVDRVRIVNPDATWVTRKREKESLVLTACHPLYSAAQRIVVFSTLVRSESK
jgi:sortase A